jgi:hypothetical protein
MIPESHLRKEVGMARKAAFLLSVLFCLALLPGTALATEDRFSPGAPGVGDPYFPLAGNGGYDVQSYLLDLKYDPSTNFLSGEVTIRVRAKQNLSQFNLDFEGLTVRSIKVNGDRAKWEREGGELIIRPDHGLRDNRMFTVVVRYDGVPEPITDESGTSGFIHTNDGAVVAGQPRVAATWFPVNDHPIDKAAYTIKLTVPSGLEAISNGILESRHTHDGWTTWSWQAREPMASYMVTAAIGEFDINRYRADGIRYWDAIDTALFEPVATPRTGAKFAISQIANLSYKRLAHTISVPAGGAQLSFWVTRDTEPSWDFLFVEAHTVGQDNWTTLPDTNGHTSQDTGSSCPFWHQLHPFLTHYQADAGDGSCTATGTSGQWWAASGASEGMEQWSVDLAAWAGSNVEVSISYASDDTVQNNGVFVDDILVSTGSGTTSFEDDGDVLDGWTVPGAPEGSSPNPNDWIVGAVADTPSPLGENIQRSFARQPEIIAFLSNLFGDYPFSAAGGIVDSNNVLGFALETQTRPIYAKGFFRDQVSGDSVVVHELAHQWVGDSLALARWQHIWLNEGFATYSEWLWSEREGLGTAQELFDFYYGNIPAEDPFWSVQVGDPGPDALFDFAVYARGAMALHQLRLAVGDEVFFRILREWAHSREGDNVTTKQFIRLAERISGQELSPLFDTWLFTTDKPVLSAADQQRAAANANIRTEPVVARRLLKEALRRDFRR